MIRVSETEVAEKANSDGFTFWVPVPLFPIHCRLDWLWRLTDINPTSEITPDYLWNIWQPTERKTDWHFILLQEKEIGPLNWLFCPSSALSICMNSYSLPHKANTASAVRRQQLYSAVQLSASCHCLQYILLEKQTRAHPCLKLILDSGILTMHPKTCRNPL